MPDMEARVAELEKGQAVLNERTIHHGEVIAEIKQGLGEMNGKLDKVISGCDKKPTWTVSITITILTGLVVALGAAAFAVK